jgi:hypothetical protein
MQKWIIVLLLLTSCAKDFVNPYDPATPADIWMPSELTIDTLGRNAMRLSWQQDEMHIDGFILGKDQDGTLTETELIKDSLQMADLVAVDDDTCRWVSYQVTAFAGDNRSTTLYSDSVQFPLFTQANAGQDITTDMLTVKLAANPPGVGEIGQWSIVSGSGGALSNASAYNSTFTGVFGQVYVLQWQIAGVCSNTTDDVVVNMNLTIGDTYKGGIVFYLDGNGGGLVAAPSDQSAGAEWGCYGTNLNGNNNSVVPELTGIGDGQVNTSYIVLYHCSEAGIAAKLCDELTVGGYSDWFLPSKDELQLMYQNLHTQGFGGFSSAYYWSSTESNAYNAWRFNFSFGVASNLSKSNTYYVRAVRAF